MELDDILRLSAEVSQFSRKNDLRWEAQPVITWTFADMRDFMNARRKLQRALSNQATVKDGRTRKVSSDSVEIDCYGVTFRLTCKQKVMTKHGPFGAADM